ncbi:MAG: hypothetical protein IJY11_03915 [Clostridia bacterium]|nr:hypothetical protein [Clostridia bacterium]
MKKLLRKLTLIGLVVCTLVVCLCAAACSGKAADGNVVYVAEDALAITVTEAEEGATLKDVMKKMQEDGKITYVEDGSGMVTTINGRKAVSGASGGEYWALFTSDENYGDTDSALTIEGLPTCYYAMVGYASMPAVEGETYLWAIESW